jgi:hypothetical protein
MNRRAFPKSALDEPSFVALGGLAKDGITDAIAKALRTRFGPDEKAPSLALGPDDAVGFARLKKDLPFETPFRPHRGSMAFAGGPARVKTFGTEPYDHAPDVAKMLRQVVVYLDPTSSSDAMRDGAWKGVVELVAKGEDRVLLSSIDPRATLEDTWAAAWDRVQKGRREVPTTPPELVVPRIHVDVTRPFPEVVGAPIVGIAGSTVREAVQSVTLSLTEHGARVVSSAQIVAYLSIPDRLVYDRPFLLALLRKGAERPYLLLWIGNDDLLEHA